MPNRPFAVPPQALVAVLDEDDCPTGEWAVNIVVVDYVTEGWTLGEDTGSPVVPLYDADNCVVGWVVKTVAVVEAP